MGARVSSSAWWGTRRAERAARDKTTLSTSRWGEPASAARNPVSSASARGAFQLGCGGGRVGRGRFDGGKEAVEGGDVAAKRRHALDGGLDQGGTGAGEGVVDQRAGSEPAAQQYLDQLRRV